MKLCVKVDVCRQLSANMKATARATATSFEHRELLVRRPHNCISANFRAVPSPKFGRTRKHPPWDTVSHDLTRLIPYDTTRDIRTLTIVQSIHREAVWRRVALWVAAERSIDYAAAQPS